MSRIAPTSLPAPMPIGFLPKLRDSRREWRDWIRNPLVEEVCSLSNCIRQPPGEWIEKWGHNHLGLYDSEEAAWRVCRSSDECEMFAFALIPVLSGEQGEEPLSLPMSSQLIPADYRFIGYDVVCWYSGEMDNVIPHYGCSPLSCNSMADKVKVNAFCLVDTLAEAAILPTRFDQEQCEPGPYAIVQVYRKEGAG